MIIIGADYHPGFQQIAFVDTETGDCGERRLQQREEAELADGLKNCESLRKSESAARLSRATSTASTRGSRVNNRLKLALWSEKHVDEGNLRRPLYRNRG
jgi:hypothetical protein